jgi:hypothetical protein
MFILPTPIRLNRNNLSIEHALNKGLEFKKILENIKFLTE